VRIAHGQTFPDVAQALARIPHLLFRGAQLSRKGIAPVGIASRRTLEFGDALADFAQLLLRIGLGSGLGGDAADQQDRDKGEQAAASQYKIMI
jgi:hypothetical protein